MRQIRLDGQVQIPNKIHTEESAETEIKAKLDQLEDEIFSSDLPDDDLNELLEMLQTRKQALEGDPDRITGLQQLVEQVHVEFSQKSAQKEAQHIEQTFGPIDVDQSNTPTYVEVSDGQTDLERLVNAEVEKVKQEKLRL